MASAGNDCPPVSVPEVEAPNSTATASPGKFTGRKRALLIAIQNYENFEDLEGPDQDILQCQRISKDTLGFNDDDIIQLSDNVDPAPDEYPNRQDTVKRKSKRRARRKGNSNTKKSEEPISVDDKKVEPNAQPRVEETKKSMIIPAFWGTSENAEPGASSTKTGSGEPQRPVQVRTPSLNDRPRSQDLTDELGEPEVKSASGFAHKLYAMIQDPRASEYIRWTAYGETFTVEPSADFQSNSLVNYFPQQSLSSFLNELFLHDFERVNKSTKPIIPPHTLEFQNPSFRRGLPELLSGIRPNPIKVMLRDVISGKAGQVLNKLKEDGNGKLG